MKTPAEIKGSGRMPTPEELAGFYEGLAVAQHSPGVYKWGNTHITREFGRTKFALEHIKPGMSVLECGCCDGGMSQHFIDAVGPKGHVTLVDISPMFVRRAQEYLKGRAPGEIEFHVGDVATFDTRRRYDVISAMELLEHVPDPRQVLANLYRLLRKNSGKILITVPAAWEDQLGEHLHEFRANDIAVIAGDVTGKHIVPYQDGATLYAVIDKEKDTVPYVP